MTESVTRLLSVLEAGAGAADGAADGAAVVLSASRPA